ncbi:hypothetical protein PRIPAC_82171 [Pristionchus pacificus]|uniref:Uncharacterized protein n=1 Tax=Pristionchus pacificus TaxID=54126 RepID=A0A2A6CK10_PRIPA|nr:hypothetical protein PRIPAC_82171 [Pristionchus pacificus]|eukprot:PDM78418.1 hypothetical protein PRIPAC_30997 [Pristionchus pacificus]
MLRIFMVFVLMMHMVNSGVIHRKAYRTDRPTFVYDRNCIFSPSECHFEQGQREMTFITPSEIEEELRYPRIIRH